MCQLAAVGGVAAPLGGIPSVFFNYKDPALAESIRIAQCNEAVPAAGWVMDIARNRFTAIYKQGLRVGFQNKAPSPAVSGPAAAQAVAGAVAGARVVDC